MSSEIYEKYNWQRASAELATCTVRVEGLWVPGGAKSATACITSLRVAGENNIGGF